MAFFFLYEAVTISTKSNRYKCYFYYICQMSVMRKTEKNLSV